MRNPGFICPDYWDSFYQAGSLSHIDRPANTSFLVVKALHWTWLSMVAPLLAAIAPGLAGVEVQM